MSLNSVSINPNEYKVYYLNLLREVMERTLIVVCSAIILVGVAACCHRTTMINKCKNGDRCSIISTNTVGESDSRIIHKKGKLYSIQLQDDPCDFDTYDVDNDGMITLQDLIALFYFRDASEALYEDLKVDSADEGVTSDEFDIKAPVTIRECLQTRRNQTSRL